RVEARTPPDRGGWDRELEPLSSALRAPKEEGAMTRTLSHGLAIATLALVQSAASAGVLGIDARHGYGADYILATGSSFSTFRSTLIAAGHTLAPLSSFTTADL